MNKLTLTLFVILTFPNLIALGQLRGWHIYSSAEDKFTVAVPPAVQITKTASSKDEASLDSNQRERLDSHISIYEDNAASNAASLQESKFKILVINGKAKIFESLSRDNLLTYLSVMIIGDDDDPWFTSKRAIEVNGLKGKEYVWSKESKVFEHGRSPEIFNRGRIFDEGDKIYVIVFIGENAAELKSPIAEGFLNSFRLNKRH